MTTETITPPRSPLAVGYAALAAAAAMLLIGGLGGHIAGYALCVVFGVGMAALFKRIDASRRATAYYAPLPSHAFLNGLLAFLSVVLAGVHAWAIATHLAS